MRTMTLKRRLVYALATPLVRLILALFWWSYRIVQIDGEQHILPATAKATSVIPCYWHQHHFVCAPFLRRFIRRGVKLGFLISPSVDGEIPARIARHWGAEVIRGSTTRAGAQAMRDMYNIVVKQGVSPVTTSDGPQGPLHVFKIGDVLLSQFTRAPLVPIGYAADRYWELKSWDRFIIPKPFARIAICIGEAHAIPKGVPVDDLEPHRRQMEQSLQDLIKRAAAQL